MIIKRTANAGILLNLDTSSILLDGVCDEHFSYEGTPGFIRDELLKNPPDALAFTHNHKDHYDISFLKKCKEVSCCKVLCDFSESITNVGNLKISALPTRHIGKVSVTHVSYVIEGSKCVWFMGDATPIVLKTMREYPKPDVIIVPYAYVISESAWRYTKELGAEKIILLHMPKRSKDEYELWNTMEKITSGDKKLVIPEIGQTINI